MKKIVFYLLLFIFIPFLIGCKKEEAPTPLQNDSEALALGNPSNATKDINQAENYLLTKKEYVLAYKKSWSQALWVAWHLDQSWLGGIDRQDDFRMDTDLPSSWYRVGSTDFAGSGFDRGHLCPSADRTKDVPTNSSTFLMTNMIPQAPNNNRNTWADLESYTRSIISGGLFEVYIYAGGYGTGGTGSGGYLEKLQNGLINVPSNTWKVIVVLPIGLNDVSRVNQDTRVIAVDMPNSQSINTDWKTYRTSVRDIENKTGLNFLSNIPQNIQNIIETRVDNL